MSYMSDIVISGICFKQIFFCDEKLYNISLKYKSYLICFKKTFLCTEELCHIAFKSY